jgi:hypothetical protein
MRGGEGSETQQTEEMDELWDTFPLLWLERYGGNNLQNKDLNHQLVWLEIIGNCKSKLPAKRESENVGEAMYVWCNIEAHSRNVAAMFLYVYFCVCVCGGGGGGMHGRWSMLARVALLIQHATRGNYAVCGLSVPPHFLTLSHKRHDFRKEVTEYKISALIFSTTFIWNISILRKILRYMVISVQTFSCQVAVTL